MHEAGTLAFVVTGAIFLGLITAVGWTAVEIVTRQSLDLARLPKVVGWSAVVWFLVAWAMAVG